MLASIKNEPSNGRVGYEILGKDYGPGTHKHHFLNEFHFFVQGQPKTLKKFVDHFRSYKFVCMEGPPNFFIEFFGRGLANIMQKGSPAQPDIIRIFGNVINYFQGMPKIVLVPLPFYFLNAFQVH